MLRCAFFRIYSSTRYHAIPGTDRHVSYADALAQTDSESVEAIVRKRRILFAGFVARMGEERLPQTVMFGEFVGGKGYSGGQEKDWMDHLKEDMSVFGMKFEGWRKVAQKAGGWFQRVEEGAELFMRNWHETERCRAAERRAKAAAAPSTVGISKRPGGGGRGGGGGVMPKRLKSGFGHHRLESCGPSNGRHKIAEDRPDFVAMLRSLPSAIDDALDTLYEPNAVFSQFLGSASMTFFFLFFFSFPFLASSSCVVFSCFSCLFLFFPFLFRFFLFLFHFLFFSFLSFIFFSFLCFLQLTYACRAYP